MKNELRKLLSDVRKRGDELAKRLPPKSNISDGEIKALANLLLDQTSDLVRIRERISILSTDWYYEVDDPEKVIDLNKRLR